MARPLPGDGLPGRNDAVVEQLQHAGGVGRYEEELDVRQVQLEMAGQLPWRVMMWQLGLPSFSFHVGISINKLF